jgi:hypothetical protein
MGPAARGRNRLGQPPSRAAEANDARPGLAAKPWRVVPGVGGGVGRELGFDQQRHVLACQMGGHAPYMFLFCS